DELDPSSFGLISVHVCPLTPIAASQWRFVYALVRTVSPLALRNSGSASIALRELVQGMIAMLLAQVPIDGPADHPGTEDAVRASLAFLAKHAAGSDRKPRRGSTRQACGEHQCATPGKLPANIDRTLTQHLVTPARPNCGQARHDLSLPYRQYPAIPAEPAGMRHAREVFPAELGGGESRL